VNPLLNVAREAGGLALLFARVVRALLPPRRSSFDTRELARHLYRMGVESVPIVALTAFFTGGIMVIQSGMFVRRFGATGLVGWAAGYAVVREIAPILIALMFSGRVGANNTAELGTMAVTEQIDGLRALAIEPIRFLIVPRVLAMMVMLFALTIIGDVIAIGGGALIGKAVLGVDLPVFWSSLVDNLKPWDVWHGLIKSTIFGVAIAISSCHFGIRVQGGAVGVGRAVNAAVVTAAVCVMLGDYFLTYLL
jgi:phospholipid/cholesterol/gamma-HCH transport system permease protein